MQSSTSASNSVANNTTAVNPQVNAKENYRVYDGKPEDGFHFFIMFDDGNRLYFILYDNQLAVIRPNIKSFIDGWEGYAKPKGDLVIPKEIEYNGQRLGVVAIKDKAFNGCDKLTSVVLPNTIKVIESGSFSHCSRSVGVLILLEIFR